MLRGIRMGRDTVHINAEGTSPDMFTKVCQGTWRYLWCDPDGSVLLVFRWSDGTDFVCVLAGGRKHAQ